MLRRAFAVACLAFVAFSAAAAPDRARIVQLVEERAFRRGQADLPAESPQTLALLYGEDARAAGISLRQLSDFYDEAYRRGSEKRPIAERIQPSTGWLVAALLLIGFVFHDVLKRFLADIVTRAVEAGYAKLAGLPWVQSFSLRRYRAALRLKYSKFPVTFRPGVELEMGERYVPLRVRGRGGVDGDDATARLRGAHRALILGAPGSGKSLLLRSIALAYGEGRTTQEFVRLDAPMSRPRVRKLIPVLVELSSLNDSQMDVEASIVDSFARRDFPRASRFVRSALADGLLLVLLDGFDEVASARRADAAAQINLLMDRYHNSRFIVTCRGPAYHGEFDASISDEFEVVDFTDQQIITFLRPWQRFFPAGKNVEQLMQTLRDRPQIMLLARNPLLLTIVAFLYTDKEFILPNSRAEFYDQAADILLRQLKNSQNVYKAPQKRLVLEHLALYNQSENEDSLDRRTMTYQVVMRELRTILPQLNLENDDAEPLLNEIVERSALLMAIENGGRYQFPHLTLQEFFAAAALAGDADRLLSEFANDGDTWREVVKLWCGLEHDSTHFIRAVQAVDPLTAFECLADAQKIEPDAADDIISDFCRKFESGTDVEERVQRAFAAVASDRRPRGAAVFSFLTRAVVEASSEATRLAAASALSLTNLPDAASFLAKAHSSSTKALDPLIVRMGDVAVAPVVDEFDRDERSRDAVPILAQIATPAAFKALLELVYCDLPLPEAAIAVGKALDQPAFRDAVRDLRLSEAQSALDFDRWVWAPFGDEDCPEVAQVAGRIVSILKRCLVERPQLMRGVDPRLLTALCFEFRKSVALVQALPAFWDLMRRGLDVAPAASRLLALVDDDELPRRARAFLAALLSLPPADIVRIAGIMMVAAQQTTADWESLRSRIEYEFASGWHLRLLNILLFVCSALAAWTATLELMRAQDGVHMIFPGLVLGALLLGWHWRWTKLPGYDSFGRYRAYPGSDERLQEWLVITIAFAILPVSLLMKIYSRIRSRFDASYQPDDDAPPILWVQLPVVLFTPGLIIYYFMGLRAGMGVVAAFATLVVTLLVVAALTVVGLRRERAARNPLTGILAMSFFAEKGQVAA